MSHDRRGLFGMFVYRAHIRSENTSQFATQTNEYEWFPFCKIKIPNLIL